MFLTAEEDEHEEAISDEKIISILKEAEAGLAVKELCRKYNTSDATESPLIS